MTGLSILLVDDHPIVREGYRRLLERQPGFFVCGEAEDAAGAYRQYKALQPDVVVIAVALPGASGVEAVRHIRQWDRNARLLVFSMHQGAAFALKAFEAGASGYVTKSSAPSELLKAVGTVAKGGRALSDDVARQMADHQLDGGASAIAELGVRETEILRLAASGLSSDEIAGALGVSQKTVQNYHYQIKAKIGARNDAHLVWLAAAAGLVDRLDVGLAFSRE